MKKQRNPLLNQVFQKFLIETLSPINPENLANLISGASKDNIMKYSQMLNKIIVKNSNEEFQAILAEKEVPSKLDRLDNIIQNSTGFQVDMTAFSFVPHDPDSVKKSVIMNAKKEEIVRLRHIAESLSLENEKLAKLSDESTNKAQSLHEKVENIHENMKSLIRQ